MGHFQTLRPARSPQEHCPPRALLPLALSALARPGSLLLCSVLLAPVLAACAPPQVSLTAGPGSYEPSDYKRVQSRWTREESLTSIEELDNVLTATATFESPDFLSAYLVRTTHDYRLPPLSSEEARKRAQEEAGSDHHFYVALYAQRQKDGDLLAENPAFVVHLVDDQGHEVAPSAVTHLRKVTARERAYFPYTTPFRTVYRLTFPARTPEGNALLSPGTRWFGLRFSGAQGQMTVTWQVEP